MNSKTIKIVKIASIIASLAGMLGTAWVGDKENRIMLEKLVNDRLGK
jgi:hypothetical protein